LEEQKPYTREQISSEEEKAVASKKVSVEKRVILLQHPEPFTKGVTSQEDQVSQEA
jgi:lipoate-protein ligase B